jgi:hypothetical protein
MDILVFNVIEKMTCIAFYLVLWISLYHSLKIDFTNKKISDSFTQQLTNYDGTLITGYISSYAHFIENSFGGKTKQIFSLPPIA